MVGAILTQNTAWSNVEKALDNLKQKNVLSLHEIVTLTTTELKKMIQPSGFFNQKAVRLQHFVHHLKENYNNNLDHFFQRGLIEIRQELLSLPGIGPETADSMLLYAGGHPVFVVDAYTKRICSRLPFSVHIDTYETIQKFFEQNLQKTFKEKELVPMYQEFHALIVELAKNYCKKKNPLCPTCPLKNYCDSILP